MTAMAFRTVMRTTSISSSPVKTPMVMALMTVSMRLLMVLFKAWIATITAFWTTANSPTSIQMVLLITWTSMLMEMAYGMTSMT